MGGESPYSCMIGVLSKRGNWDTRSHRGHARVVKTGVMLPQATG